MSSFLSAFFVCFVSNKYNIFFYLKIQKYPFSEPHFKMTETNEKRFVFLYLFQLILYSYEEVDEKEKIEKKNNSFNRQSNTVTIIED